MNKKIIYTAITGDYDKLQNPSIVSAGWKYICFTNNKDLKSDFWDIIYVEDNNLSNVKLARKIKIKFHEYVSDADISIWHDANLHVCCYLDQFVAKYHKSPFTTMKHPDRTCIYKEALTCVQIGKDAQESVSRQMEKYDVLGHPDNTGLIASGLLIREKTDTVIKTMDEWWKEVLEFSHRDQLSFNFIINYHRLPYPHTIPFTVLEKEFIRKKHEHGL